jgi:hypothetical protein
MEDGVMEIREQVQYMAHFLDGYDIDFVVAGGFARDIYYGQRPRDADFWIENTGEALALLLDIGTPVTYAREEEIEDGGIDGYVDMMNETNHRIEAVFKWNDLDLIIIGPGVPELGSVTETFDCNLNEFTYEWQEDAVLYQGAGSPPKAKEELEFIRRDVGEARMAYMRLKAEKILKKDIGFKEMYNLAKDERKAAKEHKEKVKARGPNTFKFTTDKKPKVKK